ncbi:MAG: DUF1232 domain-containing protein [Myxococcota bacterium]|nr:DUF1232 domain-containing protein [Myxococcota bacterium]
MSDNHHQCLEAFPSWLASLPLDLRSALVAARSDELGEEAKRYLLGAVNYLFKSLDLIPDGIDDIGYLDDAFVLRFGARAALREAGTLGSEAVRTPVENLAKEAVLVDELLGDELAKRFETYVAGLRTGAARGRMVDELLSDPNAMRELEADVNAFHHDFAAPSFSQDEKNLVKLIAFLDAKLPAK